MIVGPVVAQTVSRHGDGVEDVADHVRDCLPSISASGPQDQPVAEHAEGDGLHVLVGEEVPAFQHRPARAQRSRFSAARGLAPRATSGCCRLSSASCTMYSNSESVP